MKADRGGGDFDSSTGGIKLLIGTVDDNANLTSKYILEILLPSFVHSFSSEAVINVAG